MQSFLFLSFFFSVSQAHELPEQGTAYQNKQRYSHKNKVLSRKPATWVVPEHHTMKKEALPVLCEGDEPGCMYHLMVLSCCPCFKSIWPRCRCLGE